MGKKNGRKREREDDEDAENKEVDDELEAELLALQEIQNERNQSDALTPSTTPTGHQNYNKEGLLHCIESLNVNKLPFIESMAICEYDLHLQDEKDDLERELAFYNHALQAVQIGKSRFAELKIPFKRPDDYFCESLKSDAHMARIKDRLIIEEKRIDAFEKRKQRELNRKYNKQVAALRKSEKSQHVKSEINSSKKEFQDRDDGKNGKARPQKSFKRQAMDKKYGFGGKEKKKAKMNDQKSLNDFSQYNPRGGKLVRREKKNGRGGGSSGGSGSGKKNGKGANRPGKKARLERRAARSSSA